MYRLTAPSPAFNSQGVSEALVAIPGDDDTEGGIPNYLTRKSLVLS